MSLDFDIMSLEDILDDEVEIYGFNNSLDDSTIEELHFIANSFAKFFKKEFVSNGDISRIIKKFEDSLSVLTSGIFGRSFETNAVLFYKNIPTIDKLYKEGIEQLEAKIKTLTKNNSLLEKENEELREEINNLKKSKSSIKTSGTSSSYGGCGGGRSYGSC